MTRNPGDMAGIGRGSGRCGDHIPPQIPPQKTSERVNPSRKRGKLFSELYRRF
jgi:hypothetical protein